MPPGPAARKNDKTVHFLIKIITGSPDTTIKGQKAARLWDIVETCKIPYCKPPMGRIVTASMTVFINKVGAARLFDLVLCNAAAIPGTEPPGGTPPRAEGYRPRNEDHYEKLFEIEHERSQFDDVDPKARENYDGSRKAPQIPVGVPPAAVKPRTPPPPPKPRGASKPAARKPGDKPNPVRSSSKPKPKPPAKKAASLPAVSTAAKPRLGQGVGGSALGPPTERAPGPKPPEEKEKERKETRITLRFPINLRFGMKMGMTIPAPGLNSIFFPSVDWKTMIGG